ncbi:hypothetical protein [Teredinibacter haidensis]|uniref:hypothetical protein n=1 Tax=Teredinibacter haidensis TaxID=2731755 RepID=UPI000948A8A0|nr:hypothetical protein [Teredinibacter haidensis]
MKNKTLSFFLLLAVSMLMGNSALANEHSVTDCSWVTTQQNQTYYWITVSQAYQCTLVESGNAVTPLTRTIKQQKRPIGSTPPGAPTCSIVDHGVYSHTGTCFSPTLITPAITPPSEPCGDNAGHFWGSLPTIITSTITNQISQYCGGCGFNIRPLYSNSDGTTALGAWCNN